MSQDETPRRTEVEVRSMRLAELRRYAIDRGLGITHLFERSKAEVVDLILRLDVEATIGPACERGGEIVDYTIGLCSCGQCPTPRADWACGCIDVMSGQPGRSIDSSACPVHRATPSNTEDKGG